MRHDLENASALLHDLAHKARDVRDALGAGYPPRLYLEALRQSIAPRFPSRRVDKLTTWVGGKPVEFAAGATLMVGGFAAVHAIVADSTRPHHLAALRRRIEALDVGAGVLLNFADAEVTDAKSFVVVDEGRED
jgi:hypothetical protein